MSRDHRKLRVFDAADALIVPLYKATATFPIEERYGLQTQLRKAAISVPVNIVEGCARRTEGEYLHFLNIAVGSAAETVYLLEVSARLGLLSGEAYTRFSSDYSDVLRSLKALVNSFEA